MPTALDIITDAVIRIGVYAPGESITSADQAQCLSMLNDMVDGWSNDNLACYEITEQQGTLTPGQSAYTIGTSGGATFNLPRPLRLVTGFGAAYTQDQNGNNYGIDVVERDRWNLIGNRTDQVQSDFPSTLFYDPQYPLGVLNFYPVPTQSYLVFWDSYLLFSEFAAINTAINLPQGYKDALQKNLASEIWPYFKSGEVSPTILRQAQLALAKVKRNNKRQATAVYDPEIVSKAVPTYNWYNDSFSR